MEHQPLTCVSVYIEGWRDAVVLSHGRKYLTVFTAATLERVRLPAAVTARPCDYPPRRLARRLRRNARTFPPACKEVAAAIAAIARAARA